MTLEEMKKKTPAFEAHDKAVSFNKKHSPWVYQVSSWDAKRLRKKLDDLLEDKEEPESRPASSPASAPATKPAK
jgi:hypothetical protein